MYYEKRLKTLKEQKRLAIANNHSAKLREIEARLDELDQAFGPAKSPSKASAEEQPQTDAKQIDYQSMTVAQLRDYAAENEIDLSGVSRKADIISRIVNG